MEMRYPRLFVQSTHGSLHEEQETPSHSNEQLRSEPGEGQNPYESKGRSTKPETTSSGPSLVDRSIWKRIGWYANVVLFSSTIVMLAAVGVLIFLWKGNRKNTTWHAIVFADWTTRSVTLTALAIRWAISAQAAIATSMMAAIGLERRSVPIHKAAEFSITRYVNSGPLMSLLLFFSNMRGFKEALEFGLVILLSSTTIGLQFTSTLLLSDITPGVLDRPPINGTVMAAMTDGPQRFGFYATNYWTTTPSSFASFVEYSEPGIQNDSVADTGVSIRGFLPVSSENARSALRTYSGVASLFDTRVFCTRPSIDFSDLRPTRVEPNPGETITALPKQSFINHGHVIPFASIPKPPNLVHNDTTPVEYDCTVDVDYNTLAPRLVLCQLNDTAGGLISRLDPSQILSDVHWDPDPRQRQWYGISDGLDAPISLGRAYLLWDYRNLKFTGSVDSMEKGNITSYSSNGPWLEIGFLSTGLQPSTIGVTMCYDSISTSSGVYSGVPQDFNITATSPTNRTEPEPDWNIERHEFSMPGVRNQLGATSRPLSLDDRGVMHLSIDSVFNEVERMETVDIYALAKDRYNLSTYPCVPNLVWMPLFEKTFIGIYCSDCNSDFPTVYKSASNLTQMNHMQDVMFTEILNDTANPALALQAQLTMLLRMAYYDSLPAFDYNATYSSVSVAQKLLPGAETGLYVVILLIAIHLLLVVLVAARFCFGSKLTLLDNAWLVLSQVHMTELESTLKNASMATDSKVMELLKESGMAKTRVRLRIVADPDEQRVGMIKI